MIQVTPQMRILVATEPADFRRGIDGLSRLCKEKLKEDAFSGCLFVFRNRRATSLKILTYDGQGFWLCHKRLSAGRFRFWPTAAAKTTLPLEAHELGVLLACGNPAAAKGAPLWRRVAQQAHRP
jgi:transposase